MLNGICFLSFIIKVRFWCYFCDNNLRVLLFIFVQIYFYVVWSGEVNYFFIDLIQKIFLDKFDILLEFFLNCLFYYNNYILLKYFFCCGKFEDCYCIMQFNIRNFKFLSRLYIIYYDIFFYVLRVNIVV